MGCVNCNKDDIWSDCTKCQARYMDYDGLFHSILCPRCGKDLLQARSRHTASLNPQFRGFVTNEVQADD